jgi:hypothetical protein
LGVLEVEDWKDEEMLEADNSGGSTGIEGGGGEEDIGVKKAKEDVGIFKE